MKYVFTDVIKQLFQFGSKVKGIVRVKRKKRKKA